MYQKIIVVEDLIPFIRILRLFPLLKHLKGFSNSDFPG